MTAKEAQFSTRDTHVVRPIVAAAECGRTVYNVASSPYHAVLISP